MKYLMLLCKGFIIGVAKIIPGVSGAVIAMSFGVYERLVNIMSKPTKIRINDVKFLILLGIGAALGVCMLSKSVKWCLENVYFPTILLFTGLIVGGLSDVLQEAKKSKFNLSKLMVFIICFSLIYYFINIKSKIMTLNNNLVYVLIGSIESLTTVIPGISGTAIFMALGWYDKLLNLFEKISCLQINFNVGLFFFGFILSTILISKLITFLFNKNKALAYTGVLAFMVASLFMMLDEAFKNNISVMELFIGIILFIIGFWTTKKFNYFFSKL